MSPYLWVFQIQCDALQSHQRNLNTKDVFFRKLYVAVWNIYHSCHSHLCLEPRSFQKKTAYSCQTTYLSVNKKVTFWGGVLGENLTCSQQKPNRNMLSFFCFFSSLQFNGILLQKPWCCIYTEMLHLNWPRCKKSTSYLEKIKAMLNNLKYI